MKKLQTAQLVHADVNPENFIVAHDRTGWSVFVLDIDGGGLLGPPGPIYPMSQPKRMYKAPELCAMQWEQLHKENLFFAPDAWSLAVLLYQLLVDYEGPFCSVQKHPNPTVKNYQPFKPYAYRDRFAQWPMPWQEGVLKDAKLPHQLVSLFYETFQHRFLAGKKENGRSRPTAERWETALSPLPDLPVVMEKKTTLRMSVPPPPRCHVITLRAACASAKSAQPPRRVTLPVSVASGSSGANAVSTRFLPPPDRQATPLCRGQSLPAPVTKKRARFLTVKGLLSWCRSLLGAKRLRPWPFVTTLL
jgi:hypothetical protein